MIDFFKLLSRSYFNLKYSSGIATMTSRKASSAFRSQETKQGLVRLL